MKTSHFEGRVASWAAGAAQGRDESTQREPATFDINFGLARLVGPADRPQCETAAKFQTAVLAGEIDLLPAACPAPTDACTIAAPAPKREMVDQTGLVSAGRLCWIGIRLSRRR